MLRSGKWDISYQYAWIAYPTGSSSGWVSPKPTHRASSPDFGVRVDRKLGLIARRDRIVRLSVGDGGTYFSRVTQRK
jgi:hypothetical protein